MTEIPVWLLDVDGVINVTRSAWGSAPVSRNVYVGGHGFRVRWAPQLVSAIRDLHRSGRVEVRWCTSWCNYAHLLEGLWQFPAFARTLSAEQCETLMGSKMDAAKQDVVETLLADGRRVIWTDDTAAPAFGPLHDRLTKMGALVIRPSPRKGLSPDHLNAIDRFL